MFSHRERRRRGI